MEVVAAVCPNENVGLGAASVADPNADVDDFELVPLLKANAGFGGASVLVGCPVLGVEGVPKLNDGLGLTSLG